MQPIVELIDVTDAFISNGRTQFYGPPEYFECTVKFTIRYSLGDITDVHSVVKLPPGDYTITELRKAAFEKAKDALLLLHRADYAVSPLIAEAESDQLQNP